MKIVSEVGLVHDGSLGNALAYIDAIAAAGADAVKFQHHGGDPCNRFRPGTFFPQDSDRQSYYQRTAFTSEQWQMLYNRAKLRGIEFGCSVWSADTVGWLHPFVDFWKVPSGEVGNKPLLEAMAKSGKPVVLSSGMSTTAEISAAMRLLRTIADDAILFVLQCCTSYPCPPEKIGLNMLSEYYRCDGLSDHSGTIWPGIIAAWESAGILEVHVCWSKEQYGADVSSSLTIEELRQLVRGVRFVETMRKNPVDKDALAATAEIQEMRRVFVEKA